MTDFADRPFVAGSLTGVRSFRVDDHGRLRGPVRPAVFKPGENVAQCDVIRFQLAFISIKGGGPFSTQIQDGGLYLDTEKKHRPGEMDCTCGYYAYFDNGSNPHHDESECVYGVIQGYGVTTVGSRGFRAEKAKLLALIDPNKGGLKERFFRLLNRMAAPFDDPVVGLIGLMTGAMTVITGLVWGGVACASSLWYLFAFLLIPVGALLLYLPFRAIEHDKPIITGRAMFNKVRRNYPDVPVYPSIKAALKDFPLTPPPPPSPEDDDSGRYPDVRCRA